MQGDPTVLLDLLPRKCRDQLAASASQLTEVQFDIGTEPQAFIGGERVFLAPDGAVVTADDLRKAVKPLLDRFGPDNRACLDGELHRISCFRDKRGEIYGLTMRVGRYVHGGERSGMGCIARLYLLAQAYSSMFRSGASPLPRLRCILSRQNHSTESSDFAA